MLLSMSYKFIFIANLRNASTSIERHLRPYSEIAITQTMYGKHMSLEEAERDFAACFTRVPREQFLVFAVIREPVDWLVSLYRLHAREAFRGLPHYTGDIDFPTFVDDWALKYKWAVKPQCARLESSQSVFADKILLPFDNLDKAMPCVVERCKLPKIAELPKLNANKNQNEPLQIDERIRRTIAELYADDYAALEKARLQFT